ncbi:MAG: outer membrane beta-barrel protein, partial [Polyangiales bacterium]
LTLDLGYFAAFVGVENADEWRNPTFTRGIIYFKMQPFRHLGLRALIQPHDRVDITVIVANGSIFGTSFPSDVRTTVQVPAVGAQLVYRFTDDGDIRLGGVASPNGSNGNRDWEAIFDLIATWSPKAWDLFINGDYQFSKRGPLTGIDATRQWGVSVGGSYELTDDWALGLRAEYVGSEDGSDIRADFTVTGTVRYSPVEYLILSLEPRAEFAGSDIFYSRPFVTDPATGNTVPSLNQDWFFGFWIGATARIGN